MAILPPFGGKIAFFHRLAPDFFVGRFFYIQGALPSFAARTAQASFPGSTGLPR